MPAKKRILIVEDEEMISTFISACLEHVGGYEITSIVTKGEDAVKMAETDKPDIVLMDIILKGKMDGIEAAAIISGRLDIPVVYLTGYYDEEKIKRAEVTEPSGFLLKPFREQELYVTIELALYRHKADVEKKKLIKELKTALEQVKTLKGMLPICATCKKIRDDKGYWNSIEKYIEEHTDADFTHSVCPECTKKFFNL